MIPRNLDRAVDPGKHAVTSMGDLGLLAVKDLFGIAYGRSKCFPDALVSETDAKDRYFIIKFSSFF